MNSLLKLQFRWVYRASVFGLVGIMVFSIFTPKTFAQEKDSFIGPFANVESSEISNEPKAGKEDVISKEDDKSELVDESLGEELPLDEVKGITEEDFKLEEPNNAIPEPPPVESTIKLPSTLKQPVPEADVASGALTYQIPISLPAGRSGLQPDLSLSYNSLNNEIGPELGYGWELTTPFIEHRNVNGINKIYDSNDFSSSMSGELRQQDTTNFLARIDHGSSLRYELLENGADRYWKVTDKSGVQYIYGQSLDSKLSDPNDLSKIYRWNLTQVLDRNGNSVDYIYQKFDSQVYLVEITYTNHQSQLGVHRAVLEYEDRPDVSIKANTGFLVRNKKRLTKVSGYFKAQLTNETILTYDQQSANNRSLITEAINIGHNAQGESTTDGAWKFNYDSIAATSLLTNIITPTGGRTQVSYLPSAQVIDSTTNTLGNSRFPYSFYVVNSIEYQDTGDLNWTNSFEYTGGALYYNNPFDRRVAGFERVVQTDAVGNTTTTYYHQGNGDNLSFGESGDEFEKLGRPYKVEINSSTGDLYTRLLNNWQHVNVGKQSERTQLTRSITQQFDGNTNSKDSAKEYLFDEYGNLTTEINLGAVTANSNGTYTDTGDDTITTVLNYANPVNTESFIVGLPSRYQVLDGAGIKKAEVVAYYDNLPYGDVLLGNSTMERSWINGSIYAQTKYVNNEFGQVVTEIDPNNNSSLVVYDKFSLYPLTSINALGHQTNYAYDYSLGQVIETIDPNGLVSQVSYDGLGRAVAERVSNPDSSDPTELATTKEISYNFRELDGNPRGRVTTEKNFFNATEPTSQNTITFTDGFDRPIQVKDQTEALPGAVEERYRTSDTIYNTIGQVEKNSLPYFTDGVAYTGPSQNAALYTSLSYDSLYRSISEQTILGITTTGYDQWRTTITDPLGHQKTLRNDAHGRLVEVTEFNQGEEYDTKYTYDTLGNLIKLEDALGNEREIEYDRLGRRIQLTDLHNPDDQSYSVWGFEYDLIGNLTAKNLPDGSSVDYGYDQLNRAVSEDFNRNNGVEVTWVYDNCPNGVGRICTVTNQWQTENYSYDILGRTGQKSLLIDNQTFNTQYSYDLTGNNIQTINPDSSVLSFEYNIGNQVEKMFWQEVLADQVELVGNIDYIETGAIAKVEYNNGTVLINSYDVNRLYRLLNKRTDLTGTGQVIQNSSYQYDLVGNIIQISEQSGSSYSNTTTYGYDDLYRLTFADADFSNDLSYQKTYQYDAIGNMTYQSGVGTYYYGGNQTGNNFAPGNYANPHAVTKIVADSNFYEDYTYDKHGNMLTAGERWQYTWDYNNRLVNVYEHGVTPRNTGYGYGSDGIRTKVDDGFITTLYPSSTYNINSNGLKTKHASTSDLNIATINGDGVGVVYKYLHVNHLGSIVATTNSSGDFDDLTAYFPYGAIHLTKSGDDGFDEQRQFLGREYDDNTNLSYLQARYYNGETGRFLSQDPVFMAMGDPEAIKQYTGLEYSQLLADPQSHNAYAYARNNPVNLSDPDGEFVFAPFAYMAAVAVMAYAPVAINYANSLLTPLGQHAIVTSINDYQKGNTTIAVVGVFTAGSGNGYKNVARNILPKVGGKITQVSKQFVGPVNPYVQAQQIAKNYDWRDPSTLVKHYNDHASKFGITSQTEYARSAKAFKANAITNNYQTGYNPVDKSTLHYNKSTNEFGAYDPITGQTRTYFKPDNGAEYINNLKKDGRWIGVGQ